MHVRKGPPRKEAKEMGGMIFTPGPSRNTVRAADGRVLTVPVGWVLLPPGDAALTRAVKAAGEHWVVQGKKGRKVFSRGVWAPAATIGRIRAELEAERSTEGYAKRKQADATAGRRPRPSTSRTSSGQCCRSWLSTPATQPSPLVWPVR
jgi:hypothetical protein